MPDKKDHTIKVGDRVVDLRREEDISLQKEILLKRNQIANVELAIEEVEVEIKKNERKKDDVDYEILALEDEFRRKVRSKMNSKLQYDAEILQQREILERHRAKLDELLKEMKTLEAAEKKK